MRLNLKYNGLAWYVENDSSDITNEMYVYNTDGSLSHVVSDSNYTDYDGDGTEIFEETTSGCTFYKYIGAISEQICAIPLENNVFKLIAADQYSAPTIFNVDKSKLGLDVALSQSKTIGDMYANFQAGVDAIYDAVVAEGVTPSASTPTAIATAIATIRNGGTATAAQILSGNTAYASKSLLTGTMTNRGAWTGATTGSGNVAIPAGYHNGSGYVSGSGAYNAGRNQGRADAGNWYVESTGIVGAGVTRAVSNNYFYALAINTVSYSAGATFSISGANAIGYQAFNNDVGLGWLIYIKTTSSSLNISVSGAGNSMYILSRLGPAS